MKYSLGLLIALCLALVGCNLLPAATATPTIAAQVPPPQPTRALEPAQTPAPGTKPQITPGDQPKPQITPGNQPPANKPQITPSNQPPAGVKPQITPVNQPPFGAKPQITPPGNFGATGKTYSVTNPTTNAKLHVQVFAPADAGSKKYPALVLVPGGTGDSSGFVRDASELMNAGFVVVIFDPDGRGKSEGVEDFNGHKHQDGLAAVARFTATLPEVDAKKIGIATFSYGITMGAGALARYPDLPVKFLLDWEGPTNRNYTTTGCGTSRQAGIQWQPCTDNAWWSEREAITFIAKVRVPYQRIQSEKDHVQPNNNHALEIVNAAVQAKLPFVRLNDYPANQTYDVKNPPKMFAEDQDRQRTAFVAKYALELANW
ncbi:MAG: hypothetical protein HZC40_25305 [Chloroflexi bacterium]|nr:hypothetical protein [Chloroflexota bacterium]